MCNKAATAKKAAGAGFPTPCKTVSWVLNSGLQTSRLYSFPLDDIGMKFWIPVYRMKDGYRYTYRYPDTARQPYNQRLSFTAM